MATGDISKPSFATSTSTSDWDYASPIVAGVTGKKIRVIAISASALTTAGSFTLKSSGGTAIFQSTLAIGTPIVAYCPSGLCESLSGEGITPSNGTGVDSFVNLTTVTVDV